MSILVFFFHKLKVHGKSAWNKSLSAIFKKILFIFRERGRERERDGEKHQCVVAFHTPPTGDLVHNPGMCPDWESNQWPCALQSGAQSTEPHQSGISVLFFSNSICSLCVSVPHFGNYHNVSNFFITVIFVMVICDQWSLMWPL